jgi:predicted ATPase
VVVLQRGADDAAVKAEEDFRDSIELARTQEALAWELRTTTSLARLRRDQGRIDQAYELLSSVYSRFNEGHETNDLRVAKSLLDELSGRR